jgi:hypothetical protein
MLERRPDGIIAGTAGLRVGAVELPGTDILVSEERNCAHETAASS